MTATPYPLPRPNAQTQPYWDGMAAGELRYQCCGDCGHVQPIPRSLCEACQSRQLDWLSSKRFGTVVTFTIVHRAPLPAFKSMVPYVIAIVEMDEGFRVMCNAVAEARDGMEIGSRVRIGFHHEQGMAFPVAEAVWEPGK